MDGASPHPQILDTCLGAAIIGFALGVIAESLFIVPALLSVGMGMAFALLCLFLKSTLKLWFLGAGILLCGLALGALRFEAARPNAAAFSRSIGQTITITGVIEEPSVKKFGVSFVLDTQSGVNISVSAKSISSLHYGDEVSVTGKLENPKNFTTDQGTEFDYVSYLYKDSILYQMGYAEATVLSHGKGNWFVAHLIPLKETILQSFRRVLPPKEASLLAGLDLGEKGSIDPQFRDDLVATGTIHIIALSGYNVTIVATFLKAMLSHIGAFGPIGANIGGAFGIIFFVVMTGLQSSGVRAGVMALIALFAEGSGRTYDAFRALIFAGFLMILWDPKYLVYDVSFQLSFLATLGIIFVTPILERAFSRVPQKILFVVPLRELMSATLGAQAMVMPFILYKMGTLSLISLPANIVVLPAIPFAMGFGALAGFIGMFSTAIAFPVAWITSLLLEYITAAVSFFARVPFASVTIKNFPIILCLALYAILIFFLHRAWNSKKKPAPPR